MRFSTVVLLVLAVSVVTFSGCKARGKNGAIANRSVSHKLLRRGSGDRAAAIGRSLATRGTAQCDCFTCRSKRQAVQEEYAIESTPTPLEHEIEPESISFEQPQVLRAEPTDAIQEIHGDLIGDSELTNELPVEPMAPAIPEPPAQSGSQTKPATDGQRQLVPPKTGLNTKKPLGPKPVVHSRRIKAKPISANLGAVTTKTESDDLEPIVNESIFKMKTRDDSVLEIKTPKQQRRKSLWFTPTVEHSEPALVVPTPAPAVEYSKPTPAVEPQPSQPTDPEIFSAPIIKHEIKNPQPSEPIVLKARPVDHHIIYNSRHPIHAPVRQARLTTDSQFVKPPRHPRNTQLNFYPLPPQQPSHVSPVPVAPVPVTPAPAAPVLEAPQPAISPQASSQSFRPVPQQVDDSAELRLKATAGPTSNQQPELLAVPTARVVPTTSPMLKLNASPTANQTQQLPAIVKIQGQRQDRVVVGSIQTPQGSTSPKATTGLNRLHTSPWQPMQTGQNGSKQVQRSIRQLMIQPQQEANFGTDGIHR